VHFNAPARLTFAFALTALIALLFLALWRRDRTQPALAWWALGHGLWVAAVVLLGLRDIIPGSVSIMAAGVCANLGIAALWTGARQFGGEARGHRLGLLIAGAAWPLASLTDGFYDSPGLRVGLGSLFIMLGNVAIAVAFIRGMRRDPLPSHRAVIVMPLLQAAVQAFRIIGSLTLPVDSAGQSMPEAGWNTLLIILFFALQVGQAILLVSLALERSERASNAVLAAARDAADTANAAKSRFVARMSHEIRTPLNGVLGLAQALAHDPALPPQQQEQAATLERAGQHLLAIVNDALDLAQVEAGRLQLAPAPIRLRTLLEETLELIQPAAIAKRILLWLDPAEALPEAVLADAVRLRQVLLNLLGNAVKFTPVGGAVTLRADRSASGMLRLTVTDTGPGIPPGLRPRLFGDFAAGPQAEAGTGLGLAISAALAHAMGGTLSHAPGPAGRGSAFTALLPLHAAELPAPPPPSPSRAPGARTLRLLVVDDVKLNREVLRDLLQPDGYVVEEAEDGYAAIAALRTGPLPDAVLMDVNMPGMDGFQATEAIRALEGPAARLPVIALTGDAMPEAVAAGQAAGMDGYLTKPVRHVALLLELERVLRGR